MKCDGKLKHIDRQTAKRHMEGTRRMCANYRATIYHCQECGFYHVGQRARLHRQQRLSLQRKDMTQ